MFLELTTIQLTIAGRCVCGSHVLREVHAPDAIEL
jgi:hypothetical protein